jgi:acyl-CoA thioesterase
MPPPDDGNEYTPFEDLIRVKQIDALTFQSIALPFSPGGQLKAAIPRSYGGHVYAQSAWAACHTVEKGFQLYVCKWAM